jgi:uncharacterized membrane protein required for colicin V production
MIFDIFLVLLLIILLSRASRKGCTEDLNFTVAFLLVVRISGLAYYPLSKLLSRFISNESIAVYAGYFLAVLIVFYLFSVIVGQKIIESAKKIPKATGYVLAYTFAAFKALIIYSVIFSFIYAFPIVKKFPDKYVTPKTYRLTFGILGGGTEDVIDNFASYLAILRNPIEHFERQKEKQAAGSRKNLDAVKSHEGLDNFLGREEIKQEEKKPEDKK